MNHFASSRIRLGKTTISSTHVRSWSTCLVSLQRIGTMNLSTDETCTNAQVFHDRGCFLLQTHLPLSFGKLFLFSRATIITTELSVFLNRSQACTEMPLRRHPIYCWNLVQLHQHTLYASTNEDQGSMVKGAVRNQARCSHQANHCSCHLSQPRETNASLCRRHVTSQPRSKEQLGTFELAQHRRKG